MTDALVVGDVTVEPSEFRHVKYDATEIADLVASVAERLGVHNPIVLRIDERTPLAKITVTVEAASSDAVVTIEAQSGALENTKQLTTMGVTQARTSIGRMLLRARDRLRQDFADTPPDGELSLAEHAAWDTYCAARLARAGFLINEQRWRYNHRNRFGFTDAGDASFVRLWTADDLGWREVCADIDVADIDVADIDVADSVR